MPNTLFRTAKHAPLPGQTTSVFSRSGRLSSQVFWLFAFALLGTCSCADREGYPDDLSYPARTDLIVEESPKLTPNNPPPPGGLEKSIAKLSEVGGKILDPAKFPEPTKTELIKLLDEQFGTPAQPKIGSSNAELGDLVTKLKLDPETLAQGSISYRRNCLHCHGLAGDGKGSSGLWVSPAPRDFRHGRFKFISTSPAKNLNRPRREDILRTLRMGLHGTSMPAFGIYPDQELEALTSYVIHLSIRGEVEYTVQKTLLKPNSQVANLFENYLPDEEVSKAQENLAYFVPKYIKEIVGQYNTAESQILVPPEYPYKDSELADSIKRGHRLFSSQASDALGCVSCHIDYGRQSPWQYDEWGSLNRPSNLTAGIYKGGRRPIDLYWRVKRGIPPSKMPAVTLTGDEEAKKVWDLINFIEAMPYPAKLPEEVRNSVYGASGRIASAASPH